MRVPVGKDNTIFFATQNNKVQIESKMEVSNPFPFFQGKFLLLEIVAIAPIIMENKTRLASKEEVWETVKKMGSYIAIIIRWLMDNSSSDIPLLLQEGDNKNIVTMAEHRIYREVER